MKSLIEGLRRHPLLVFLFLAFSLFWLAMPLGAQFFVLMAIVGSFAPALSAMVVTVLTEGRTGLHVLFSKFSPKQVHGGWYLLALGIPLVVCAGIAMVSWVLGSQPSILTGPGLVLVSLVFVFAAGEELGWRGYMLPRLLAKLSPLEAALVMGAIHAGYHLPLWIAPGVTQPAYSSISFLLTCLALGILWTWLYLNSSGSILVATLFHGSFNAAGNILFGNILPVHLSLLLPVGFWLAAILVLVFARGSMLRKFTPQKLETNGI